MYMPMFFPLGYELTCDRIYPTDSPFAYWGLVDAENNTPVGSLSAFLPSRYFTRASLAYLL
jgi:hypothetical protein